VDGDQGLGVLSLLSRRPGLRVGLLLTPPMLWLGLAYLGALAALLVTSLWAQNDFTGNIERTWTLENFRDLLTVDVYRTAGWSTPSPRRSGWAPRATGCPRPR
jgi:ABC-type spermidine/putrescine transport system permease subunit I